MVAASTRHASRGRRLAPRGENAQVAALAQEIADAKGALGGKASTLAPQTVVGSTYVTAGQRGEVVMTCPASTQPVSGGLQDQDDTAPLREFEFFPDGARWIVRVLNGATQGSHAMVDYVVCAGLK